MGDGVLLKKRLELTVLKMRPLVTNDSPRCTKSRKDILFKESKDNFVVIGPSRDGFYPLGNVINREKDVKVAKRTRKWAHEIYAPHIKELYNKDWAHRHHVPPSDSS